jgi:putative PEP-CTERM system histidine kinase
MAVLIAFWTHALSAALFVSLILWRLRSGVRQGGQRLLLAAFSLTAIWAWLNAIAMGGTLAVYAETARNLVWVGMLHTLSGSGGDDGARQRGVRLVYGAVAAVLGLQLVVDALPLLGDAHSTAAVALTASILRITAAAGALVLVHNLYGQAAPASRTSIRFAMLALAIIWIYDLNLYTLAYLDLKSTTGLFEWRGAVVALTAPLFALGVQREEGWRIRLSRAATFQSLSLLAICGYFAVMTILATALRGTGWDWSRSAAIAVLAGMTVAAMVLVPSARARSWAKVKLAKHLFEHRYDYRTEWLRFTDTVGRSGPSAAPLSERVVKAFADIVDAPGGVLLVADEAGAIEPAAAWNWPGGHVASSDPDDSRRFWLAVECEGRILELDAHRHGLGDPRDLALAPPDWMIAEDHAWAGIPLIHHDRLVGLVLLAAPDYRRPLDWEDFDLLRTAGRQAASSLAEAHGQAALSNAQRFEEFNRRFAFILHDVKNLVSQLSLVARNAERHADNAEFRTDMIATLKSSVGKMNDLLARLAPQAPARPERVMPVPLRATLTAAIAAKRRDHDVRLLGDGTLWVDADANGLEQAVGQLLQNAIDASPPEEPVLVRVARNIEHVSIDIIDKGCGMDADFIRNRLFQPFVSTKLSGFGVGAFEARSLILAMGGRLTVASKPGKGSHFTIHLPAAEPASQPARKRA